MNRANEAAGAPAGQADFDAIEGISYLAAQLAEIDRLGNPFFRGHETTSADTVVIGGRTYLNFSGYNYLGLSGHPEVSEAAKAAIDRYGTSVSASRIASGEIPVHRELEAALAGLVGAEDAIVFNSGYGTNVALIGHFLGQRDAIFSDALIHNSAIVGIKLSGARRFPFRHNDLGHLDELLTEHRPNHQRALIIIEGVYSMDGDIPDLPGIIALKQKHRAGLMIDEAHSIGVLGATGRGIGEHYGANPGDVDLWMGTLSKTLASCGGYVAGRQRIVEYLKYSAPGFVYSVGLTPPDAAAALAALHVMLREPERVTRLRANAARFVSQARRRGLDTGLSAGSAVVPVILGDSLLSLRVSEALSQAGINVQPIFYPAVEERSARLRFFLSASHDAATLDDAVERIADEIERQRQAPADASGVFGTQRLR